MYVRVQNGYELNEIHDVKIATPLNNQGIFYTTSNSLWENKTIISALSGTKSEFDTACSDGNFVFQSDALGTPSSGTLTNCNGLVETGLTLSDNTTNDVTTSKHGFVPKAPNDTTKFLRGDGTWSVVNNNGGWTIIVKSANQDVTNNATLTDDTDLQFSVVAGGHYMLEMDIVISANNTTGDYKNAFFVSAGNMLGTGFMLGPNATGVVQTNIYTSNAAATSTTVPLGTQVANIDFLASTKIIYSFQASANATLSYQFANNAAAAGRTSRTWKGSILKYKRID